VVVFQCLGCAILLGFDELSTTGGALGEAEQSGWGFRVTRGDSEYCPAMELVWIPQDYGRAKETRGRCKS
jgi:hypothetical protein